MSTPPRPTPRATAARGARQAPPGTRLRLPYGGPFSVPQVLAYLGRDPHSLSERVTGRCFERHLRLGRRTVPIAVTFADKSCTVACGPALPPAQQQQLRQTVQRMLGLDQPVAAFRAHVADDPVMAPLVAAFPDLRVPQVPSLFEALSWAVIGQQINLAFAFRLRNRLIALAHGTVPDITAPLVPPARLLPFPTPAQVAALDPAVMASVQFSRQKAAYLTGIAQAMVAGHLDEAALGALPPEDAMEALQSIRGVGPWSANYAGMRALGHSDALPVGDAGLISAMRQQWKLSERPDAATQTALMERYRPYRSLACYYLWRSLSVRTDG